MRMMDAKSVFRRLEMEAMDIQDESTREAFLDLLKYLKYKEGVR